MLRHAVRAPRSPNVTFTHRISVFAYAIWSDQPFNASVASEQADDVPGMLSKRFQTTNERFQMSHWCDTNLLATFATHVPSGRQLVELANALCRKAPPAGKGGGDSPSKCHPTVGGLPASGRVRGKAREARRPVRRMQGRIALRWRRPRCALITACSGVYAPCALPRWMQPRSTVQWTVAVI